MPLYKKDPNDPRKQVPNIQGDNRRDRVTNAVTCSFHKSPNYVLVNTELTANCSFFFGTSDSFSSTLLSEGGGGQLTGSQHYTNLLSDGALAGTQLNIHPNAWSGSAADANAITFVYKSGLATGGF